MKIADKPGLSLIAEFERVKINLQIGEDALCPPGEDDAQVLIYPYGPENDPIVDYYHSFKISLEGLDVDQYKEMVEKQLKEFFEETDELVLSTDLSFTEKLNSLINYRYHFKNLRNLYTLTKVANLTDELVTCKQLVILKDIDKLTHPASEAIAASKYLKHQMSVLDRILPYVDEKLAVLNAETNQPSSMKLLSTKKKREFPPIEKYDRYEIGLIFHYLAELGVIHRLSANTLAPILSELTGHSAQKLREDCLGIDKAIAVLKGEKGNKTILTKNPSHYINSIESLLMDLFKRVREDKAKYWKN